MVGENAGGVSEVRGKKYYKMGSEGDVRRIGAAAKKRGRGTKTSHKGSLEKKMFYSSSHRAVYEGGHLPTPYISYIKCPLKYAQLCALLHLGELVVSAWGRA